MTGLQQWINQVEHVLIIHSVEVHLKLLLLVEILQDLDGDTITARLSAVSQKSESLHSDIVKSFPSSVSALFLSANAVPKEDIQSELGNEA